MKFSLSKIALVVLGAVAGALAALLFKGDGNASTASVDRERPAKRASSPVAAVPDALERALRRRIRQLEGELAAVRDQPASTNASASSGLPPMPQMRDFRPPSPREMREYLKKNDPKRYEEFRRRFTQMRQRRLERTKGRLDFLGAVETAGMSEDARANHEKLQELLARRESLPDPDEMQTDEEMREAMRQRRELDHAIRKANETERTTLLQQTATALGYEGDDASDLVQAIQEVVRATESERGGPPGPPPGGTPR